MKILITGVSGYLGFELTKKLTNHEIIGLDIKKPKEKFPNNVLFIKKSILDQDLHKIFEIHHPEICIHLAWTVTPVHKKNIKKAYELDFDGTKRIFDNCKTYHVNHIIFISSTLAYGALRDNPTFLTEENPLRAKKSFHYSYHKKIVEKEIVQPFMKENPKISVTVLRPAGFLGPTVHNYVSEILRAKLLPVMIGGRHTRIHFLHINDLLDVIDLVIKRKLAGIFNVTPDDSVIMKDLPDILPGHKIYILEFLARLSTSLAWSIHLYAAPSSYLDYVRYEFIATNEKIKDQLEWEPVYTTKEAIQSLLKKEN